ncbi:MAG: PKD domain-containing protein, partial [Nocardioidaceae bacterium]
MECVMGPGRPCAFWYEVVAKIATAIVSIWRSVPTIARWCGAVNPCIWWCLCCNVWGCWLIAILVAIVVTVLLVIGIILAAIMVVVCWILCVISVIFHIYSGPTPNCFAGTPPPPPTNQPPTVVIDGPYTGRVGTPITMSAAASTDPEGTPLTATWTLGDGTTLTGLTITHAYANVGVFNVTVTVSDGTLTSTATTTANIVAIGGGPVEPPI